jgi:hypothetical protein
VDLNRDMDCRDCPRFNAEAEKCRDNKLNPRTWDQAVSVMHVYGIRWVCVFNDHRARLALTREPLPQRKRS